MRSQKVPETGVVPSGTAAVADERATLRVWVGFIAMSIGMFMAVLDIQIVASSLPELQAALLIPLDRLSWVQTAYLSAEIVAIPLTGWITRVLTLRAAFALCVLGVRPQTPTRSRARARGVSD